MKRSNLVMRPLFENMSEPLLIYSLMLSSDVILGKQASEIFILELTLRAWNHAEQNKRRTLQKNDIDSAITNTDIFDFLVRCNVVLCVFMHSELNVSWHELRSGSMVTVPLLLVCSCYAVWWLIVVGHLFPDNVAHVVCGLSCGSFLANAHVLGCRLIL